MKNLSFILSAGIILLAVSCKKNNDLSPAKTTATATVKGTTSANSTNTTIYLAGVDGPNAVYWQNGTEHTLPIVSVNLNSNSPVLAYTYNIAVNDTDVYVTGYNGANFTYWKNGVPTTIPVYASAIKFSGTDSYFAGTDGGGNPTVMKNGSVTTLPMVGVPGYIEAMAVSGTDVYFAGNNNYHAVYWKNGIENTLPVTSNPNYSSVYAMAISGSDVYFAGQDGQAAVYWKNGVEYALPMNSNVAYVNNMTISGTDVYFAGVDFRSPVYWKNSVETTLPFSNNTSSYGFISGITADGADIYIAGYEMSGDVAANTAHYVPEYWKNGTVHTLPATNNGGAMTTGLAIVNK